MQLNNIIKYFFRFIFLQTILTSLTVVYFDKLLISNQEFKQNIYENLVEDAERFLPFILRINNGRYLFFNYDFFLFNYSLLNKVLYICK